MKLLTWNIRHGGEAANFPRMAELVGGAAADVAVLTEYRQGRSDELVELLKRSGLAHSETTKPPKGTNGVALLSRERCLARPNADGFLKCRWLEVDLPAFGVSAVGLHIPVAGKGAACAEKRVFWQHLIEFAEGRRTDRVVLIGDFNTGLEIDAQGTPFVYGEYMEQLLALGWVDAWREVHGPDAREFTWYSNAGNGFRLDYVFLSPPLSHAIRGAEHLHHARESGLSDHAPLLVTLECA